MYQFWKDCEQLAHLSETDAASQQQGGNGNVALREAYARNHSKTTEDNVCHKHSKNVLHAIRNHLQQEHIPIKLEQVLVIQFFHRRNTISPVTGSIASTIASDSNR